ncbi:MAG: hypothetical protein II453_10295 [Alphaproteobacteria bacterium]|nr:hypothetical protein [Alphaproteobacteria bacterium]MBQ3944584.1 hypothetical protein [Alphaproteobacteria bacterium]
MIFNKTLIILPCVASVMAMDYSYPAIDPHKAKEEMVAKIPDVSQILPTVKHYIEKMKNVTERYKDVFKESGEPEARQRIDNAKQKALNFFADIFEVKLSEVEKYSENFTTAQYLTWVAKEIINNGKYEFAKNEDELFDSCVDHKEPYYCRRDFGSNSKREFPKREKIPECFEIYCPYNHPYFEAMIVHETGHILDDAYRVLKNIRSETFDDKNDTICQDAVSVFFETMYTIKHDPTFVLHRLTDLYGISFRQKYVEQIKARGRRDNEQYPEIYKKIGELSNVERYRIEDNFGTLSPEQFMQNMSQKHPELSFIYDIWKTQATELNLTTLPNSLISSADDIASEIPTILKIYKSERESIDKLQSYSQYIPHVYRTMKIFNRLNSSQSVLDALDLIVKNVPNMMTEAELKDFIQMLEL